MKAEAGAGRDPMGRAGAWAGTKIPSGRSWGQRPAGGRQDRCPGTGGRAVGPRKAEEPGAAQLGLG